jgi:hypothetical protein
LEFAESNINRAHIKSTFERWETQPIDEWFSSDLSPGLNKSETVNEMRHLGQRIKEERLIMFLPQLLEYRFQLHAAWGEYEDAKKAGRQWEAEERKIGERKGEAGEEVSKVRRDPRKWGQWGQLKRLYSFKGKAKPAAGQSKYGRKNSYWKA